MKDQQKYIMSIVALVAGIYIVSNWLKTIFGETVASAITSITTMSAIIYGLHFAWDRLIWKIKWLNTLICKLVGFYEYPNINGRWKIEYESSYKNGTKGFGEATIQQSYSTLFIEGVFSGSSDFYSFFAQLKQKENGKWFLVYAYRNKPQITKLTNSLSGGMHEGFTYLDVESDNKLEGYYANDENRKTRGKLVLTKIN